MSETKFTGPLFIIGMPRSGTKLLRDLLNRHPCIGIPEIETEFLPWMVSTIQRYGDLSLLSNFAIFYEEITTTSYFTFRRDASQLIDMSRWYDACHSFTAAGIFEALIRIETNMGYESPCIWGDKSPSYIDDISMISSLYPQARFVHIVRDVRDYCLSINKAWGKDMLRAAQRWVDGINAAHQAASNITDRYREVRYEELLNDTEHVLRGICKFIQIEFKPEMLTLAKPSEDRGDAKDNPRIVQDNFGKYIDKMNPDTLLKIEAITGDTLSRLGYGLTYHAQPSIRVSTWGMMVAKLKDGVQLLLHKNSNWGLAKTIAILIKHQLTLRKII